MYTNTSSGCPRQQECHAEVEATEQAAWMDIFCNQVCGLVGATSTSGLSGFTAETQVYPYLQGSRSESDFPFPAKGIDLIG